MLKTNPSEYLRKGQGETLITAIAVGSVLILIGMIFVINAGLPEKIVAFFQDIKTEPYPPGSSTSNIFLPAPANPAAHGIVYAALFQFGVGIAILQMVILALRLIFKSPTAKMSETVGNLIFWLGAAVLVSSLLATGTSDGWFQFWGALIIVVGFSLIARGIVYFVKR
jgi:hypothetical protein